MIFMRLVWMQIRQQRLDFTNVRLGSNHPLSLVCDIKFPGFQGQVSLGEGLSYCDRFHEIPEAFATLSTLNMWLLSATSFALALAVRILSGSWLLALVSSLIVLSRGSLVTSALDGELRTLLGFLLAVATFLWTYSIRSANSLAFLTATFFLTAASLLAPGLAFHSLTLGIFILLGFVLTKRLKSHIERQMKSSDTLKQQLPFSSQLPPLLVTMMRNTKSFILGKRQILPDIDSSIEGEHQSIPKGLLSTIDIPYSYWILEHHRVHRIVPSLFLIFIGNLSIVLVLSQSDSVLAAWFHEFPPHSGSNTAGLSWSLDIHLWVSFGIFTACLVFPPYLGFLGMFEISWLVFSSLIGISLANLFGVLTGYSKTNLGSAIAAQGIEAGIIAWEPTILALSIPAAIHLMRRAASIGEGLLYPNRRQEFWTAPKPSEREDWE